MLFVKLNRIYATMIISLLLLVSNCVYASDFSYSVGGGFQYGSIIGIQGAIHNKTHRLRAALGIIGIGVGYDYKFAERFSVGVTGGEIFPFHQIGVISLNYYSQGKFDKGWQAGIDIGKADALFCIQDCSVNDNDHNIVFISGGYIF